MNIGFIGLGKLGLDCAEVFAEKHCVRGYDIQTRSSAAVRVCGIKETVVESDWIFIAVPTPHQPGSVLVDPWRALPGMLSYKIVHYGNTRAVGS